MGSDQPVRRRGERYGRPRFDGQSQRDPEPILPKETTGFPKSSRNESIDRRAKDEKSCERFGEQAEGLGVFNGGHDDEPGDPQQRHQEPHGEGRQSRSLPERERPEHDAPGDRSAHIGEPVVVAILQREHQTHHVRCNHDRAPGQHPLSGRALRPPSDGGGQQREDRREGTEVNQRWNRHPMNSGSFRCRRTADRGSRPRAARRRSAPCHWHPLPPVRAPLRCLASHNRS